ncbi:MAG TPA: carboxypeptidase regulatory-like domain-containing protein [Terriglobales bacterium]|nr:carboxypeptidase regulatory-like domain-containing protein [Terriglobales bacterium]
MTGRKFSGSSCLRWLLIASLCTLWLPLCAQTLNVSVQGRVYDASGAAVPQSTITVVNSATGLTRSVEGGAMGDYQITALPAGDYTVTAEKQGFRKLAKKVHLDIGGTGNLDFNLALGEIKEEVMVQDVGAAAEPTRTMVSSVIDEQKIENLPVNGRQFIDFALLAPGVTIGDTTSGSTDVIIEPVTKLSFAGQNIHYNFVAIDGADNMSTASGIQKTTPSQEAVQEFRVINSDYSTEFGRAVGGIVNIVTKSGTNNYHGSLYEYFRNDKMDAKNMLAAAGGFNKLRQNQFGATLGGPIQKDKTFFFANYEGQRHSESPYYNSTVLQNINAINAVKVNVFGLAPEDLVVNRTINYDNGILKMDHNFNAKQSMFVRYFINDQRGTNLSPLNDGFDLPSGFKNNYFRDQSLVGSLTSVFSSSLVNNFRLQYAHRFFDFPTVSTQPHLEVSNTFTMGVNRGNPDFYEEGRWEIVDDVTKTLGRHTISFGGDFNHVDTTESFPLFYPFEADFGSLGAFLGTDPQAPGIGPHPFVIFMERFDAGSNYTEPTINTSVYQGSAIGSAVRNQAKGNLAHTYEGLYIQDKWRASSNLTVDYGLRWEGETWPSAALNNPLKNFDPRAGFSYALGTSRNVVIRGGAGLFHGMIPSPLLMCQIPSCGGTMGAFPGRENKEDTLNATTRLFAFASGAPITNIGLLSLLGNPGSGSTSGLYPDATPAPFCPNGFLSTCGFFGDSVIVRFAKDHKPPYGGQASFGVEFQPTKDTVLDVTGLHVRGVHLGSFWNVNQPPANCQVTAHDSQGRSGPKSDYHIPLVPQCGSPANFLPGTVEPNVAVYFEADSKWDSQWDGLLVNFNKRLDKHVGWGLSYTWSKGIDNGPNPSFVLIPQDSCCFNRERAVSADSVAQRFVGNVILQGPTHLNRVVNNWQLGTIVTLESPHYFTKFAGFDANGDVFGNNDRVGIEPRDTFKGDSYQTVDMRLSRTFVVTEKLRVEAMAEGFNLLNTLNIHFYNTAYGAADFCPFNPTAGGCPATPSGFLEGSPNPSYGTPRSIFNPRQVQLALRMTW